MVNKENILILFQGEHLAYSPTVIQLYDELSKSYNVTITAEFPKGFNNQKLENRNIIYHKFYHVKSRYLYWILFQFISFFKKDAIFFKKNKINYKYYFFRYLFIKKMLSNNNYKSIISVDIMNTLFCSILKYKTDFLSLELCVDEKFLPLIDLNYIKSVIIQSKERFNYLFKEINLKTFFIQNAPNFIDAPFLNQKKHGIIYAGGAYDELGFYHCLEFLKANPNQKITVQGIVRSKDKEIIMKSYKSLIENGQLILNEIYLENDEVVPYISKFEIGLCFYNFDNQVIKDNFFNYSTAPSGKMFKYLAAGVPVVCSDIIGFQFVNEFNCGITINSLTPLEINNAILKIRENFEYYSENAIEAAKHFSFDHSLKPYLEFLKYN